MKTEAENPTGEGSREVLLGIEFGAGWQGGLPASSYEDGRRTVVQRLAPGQVAPLRTYAEHLRDEGRQDAQVSTIEGFLGAGIKWSTIKRATGIDQAAFDALRRQQRSSDPED